MLDAMIFNNEHVNYLYEKAVSTGTEGLQELRIEALKIREQTKGDLYNKWKGTFMEEPLREKIARADSLINKIDIALSS